MKKILLFVSAIFFAGYSFAQTSDDWNFIPPTTDGNHSIVFNPGSLSDFVGGQLMAFNDTVPLTEASTIQDDGSGGLAVIGNDSGCNNGSATGSSCELANSGDALTFAILIDGDVIVLAELNPPLTFMGGGFNLIDDVSYVRDGSLLIPGCTDPIYLEFDPAANYTGTKTYCLTVKVEGCLSQTACNYNEAANFDDGSCEYADDACEVCENGAVVLYDQDGDGYCDPGSGLSPEEVLGSTDPSACNYNS